MLLILGTEHVRAGSGTGSGTTVSKLRLETRRKKDFLTTIKLTYPGHGSVGVYSRDFKHVSHDQIWLSIGS